MTEKYRNVEIRELYYRILQKIFRFDVWHIIPIEARAYALHLVKFSNKLICEKNFKEEIIEIGCGIGDIIARIDYPKNKKRGYDLDANIIRAARVIHRGIKFCVGSFDTIKGHDISLLIAVNFLHAIDEKQVKQMFADIIRENNIARIIVDEVESPPCKFAHNYREILDKEGFDLAICSRSLAGVNWSRKRLLLFEKRYD